MVSTEDVNKMEKDNDIENLIIALKEPVCFEAQKALISIGEPAVIQLLKAFNYPNKTIRELSPHIIESIANSTTNYLLKTRLETLLDDIGYSPSPYKSDNLELLIKALKNPEPYTRHVAAYYLRIGDFDAVEPLLEALNDPDEDVIISATNSLLNIKPTNEQWLILLEHEKIDIRDQAAIFLSKQGEPRAIEHLAKALENPNENTRQEAALLLAELGDLRGAEELLKLLSDPHNYNFRAEEAWNNINFDETTVKPIIKAWKNADLDGKFEILRMLVDIGDPRVIEPLVKLLDVEDGELSELTSETLLRSEHEGAIEWYKTELKSIEHENRKKKIESSIQGRSEEKKESHNDKVRIDAIKAPNQMGIEIPEDEMRINYHPDNKRSKDIKFDGKRFINPYFNVFVPTEWFKDDNSILFEDSNSDLCLKRYNPEVELHMTSSALIDGITNLDIYIDDEKTYEVRDREVASEGYITIDGTKGYRIDWISSRPVESLLDLGETKYYEGTNIILIKHNWYYILRFYSDVGSYYDSNLLEIKDDINFIITNIETKNPNTK